MTSVTLAPTEFQGTEHIFLRHCMRSIIYIIVILHHNPKDLHKVHIVTPI